MNTKFYFFSIHSNALDVSKIPWLFLFAVFLSGTTLNAVKVNFMLSFKNGAFKKKCFVAQNILSELYLDYCSNIAKFGNG